METLENDIKDHTSKVKDSIGNALEKKSGSVLLCTSIGILAVAVGLKCLGHRQSALLLAQSGASLLLFGAYKKMFAPKTTK